MRYLAIYRAGLALMAATATVSAQAAEPPADCLSEAEISALTVYVMPQLISATQANCKAYVAQDGFLATESAAMVQRYAAKADAAWPLAKSAFVKFAGDSKSKETQEFSKLSDDALRPLFDGIIKQKATEAIHPKSCHDIERLAKVLSAIDPDTTGALFSVIASLAIGDKEKSKVCQA